MCARKSSFDKNKVLRLLLEIPRGKVVTYGAIAEALGNPGYARAIGRALHSNPDGDLYPCYKVVTCKGELSSAYAFGGIAEQRRRLLEEGVTFVFDRVDLIQHGYRFLKEKT